MDLFTFQFLWIMSLSFCDNVLTHYQFFLVQKKGVFQPKQEMNPIARWIMGGNPRPMSFIYLFIYAAVVIYTLMLFLGMNMFGWGAITGMFFAINIYHCGNLDVYKKNWNNPAYWEKGKVTIR